MRRFIVLLFAALFLPAIAWAQDRSATGTVVDKTTGAPVAGAVVTYEGAETPANAGDDGAFTLALPAEGGVTLTITAEGYEDASVEWTEGEVEVELTPKTPMVQPTPTEVTDEPDETDEVPDGETAAKEDEDGYIEQLVVVGRSTSARRKHLQSAVASVDGEDVGRGNPQTLSEALQGKIVGANIQSNSGAPGGGFQLSLRGVSTINGASEPLYVVDGVIISDVAIASGISAVTSSTSGSNASSTQDNQVNRIADLNPNDIANIQVLKGASAAAIYGSKASNGVVIINTKRGGGTEDGVTGSITQRVGMYQLSNTLGSRTFETEQEAVDAFGPTASQHWVAGQTYNHEEELASRRDPSFETVGSVSGRAGETDYYASILARDDKGIIPGTGYEKQGGRLSLSRSFGTRLKVQANSSLLHSVASRSMTNNDNAGVSHYMVFPFTPNFLNLNQNSDGTYPVNPFIGSGTNPFQTAALMSDAEDVWRFIGSAQADLNVFESGPHWARVNFLLGVDQFQQVNDLLFPPELFFEPDDSLPGTALRTTSDSQNLNYGLNGLYTFVPESAAFESTTSFGLQEESRRLNTVYIVSRNLAAGQPNVDAGTQIDVTQNRQLVRDRGFYVQEDVILLRERLSLVGALRFEQSSNNGDPNQLHFYPKAGAAYRLPWLPPYTKELKLRVAYGETGNQPLYGQKFTSLNSTRTIEGIPTTVNTGVTGDPDIRPERQREIEGGVDVVALNGRVVFEATLYQRTISDLLLERALAPSTGFTTQFFNGGELRNRGVELMLQAEPISTDDWTWLTRTGFSMNRSEITDLPVPAFITGGFGTALGAFRIEEGASATQIVANAGDDGAGGTRIIVVGDTEPDFRMSFFNSVGWRDVSLSFLADWQQGSEVINLTKLLYDLGQNTADFETAGQERLANWPSDARPYIEDASFLKIREIALSYLVPAQWVGRVPGVDNVTATLSARNVFTFTNYSGLDPEVSNFGNQAIARNIDVAPFPPSRSYWVSLSVGF